MNWRHGSNRKEMEITMSNNSANRSEVIPFGKYKGQPAEVLMNDPKYVEWLNGQGWVKEKYPQFYTVIINNFQEPSDTPEHNAIQALFLDDELCKKLLSTVFNVRNSKHMLRGFVSKTFEFHGIDVFIKFSRFSPSKYLEYVSWCKRSNRKADSSCIESATDEGCCGVEIKPSIGDDFPSILRQCRGMFGGSLFHLIGGKISCVVFRDFTATNVTIDQVREMFKHSDVILISLAEIEQAGIDTRFDDWHKANVVNK